MTSSSNSSGFGRRRVDGNVKFLISVAEEQGWKSSLTNKGHVKLLSPNKKSCVFIGSNTGDPHSFQNMKALFRRSGIKV